MSLLEKIKVGLFRWLYRRQNAAAWKGQLRAGDWQDLHMTSQNFDLRLFSNGGGGERPLIIYFHGGGWVIGDLDTHTPFCQQLSEASGCSVVSVDYRLAPEFPFPAAQDDCLAAVQWCMAHTTKLGPNNQQLILAGDSAGGNLAAAVALEVAGGAYPAIHGLMLLYPVVDHYSGGYQSYEKYATGHGLTRGIMQWFWDSYLGQLPATEPAALRAMPGRAAGLGQLPPTFIGTAEFDPLRDEGKIFGQQLSAAGVSVTAKHYAECAHGFACSEGPTVHFSALMDSLVQWLSVLPHRS